MMFSYFDYFSMLFKNSLMSTERVLIGLFFASVLGIVFGICRAALPEKIKENILLKIFLEAPKYPPPIAWIPFVILLAGIGELSAWLIVFIGSFPPIFTNTYEAIKNIHPNIIRTANSLEINGISRFAKIIFPAALPQLLTGIKIGAGMGWMSVIGAEMVSGQSGLGYSIQLNRLNLQYGYVTLDMIAIGLIGFLLHAFLKKTEKYLIPWHVKFYKRKIF